MKKNLINHAKLGGNVVDLTKPMPQRKPNKHQNGEELLNKAVYGTPKPQKKSWLQ